MRCQACNKLMDDREAVKKDPRTGEYFDRCSECVEVHKVSLWELEEEKVAKVEIPG